MQKIEHQGRNL